MTLSHRWGKLNLPMFPFNVGLLTLIKIDSLKFLARKIIRKAEKDLLQARLNPLIVS